MGATVTANDGAALPLDSLAQQLTYSGSFIATITVIYEGNTYVQTFLNNGTNIIYISGWVNSAAPQAQQIMLDENGTDIMLAEDGVSIMVTQ